MSLKRLLALIPLLFLFGLALQPISRPVGANAATEPFDVKLLEYMEARSIGPANMGGRIVSIAVDENNPSTMYVAPATGGIWKTTNDGKTWKQVFDSTGTNSVGAVALAPSNPNIVWVGGGECNPRNSVTRGYGVYKSEDGGNSWKHMGLSDIHHTGGIRVHPTNPDIVYVAALGRLWGPSKERGVFKTTDGGKTWEHSLAIDEDTGCVDIEIDHEEPNILYACGYGVRRGAISPQWQPAIECRPKAGLYKTTDGGKTWNKLTKDLPNLPYGRCDITIYRKNPKIIYAIIQTSQSPAGGNTGGQKASKGRPGPIERGGIFYSEDRGESWVKVNDLCSRPHYFNKIRVDPNNDQRLYHLGLNISVSTDGGKTFRGTSSGVHADHHELWINPKDSTHLVNGNDGGLYFSRNSGGNWRRINNFAIGQFYHLDVDMSRPYRVYGGLQDNGTWGGTSATLYQDGITNVEWRSLNGGDGFQCQIDPTDNRTLYCESQYGKVTRKSVTPVNGGPPQVGGGGGVGLGGGRFNWNTPILLSPHDPKTVYIGGDRLFRSSGGRGTAISPDLTRKASMNTGNGHTITTVGESPAKKDLIYVGTDDGNIQMTRDGGRNWTDLSKNIAGAPIDRWITRVEPSRFEEGTCYVTFSRYRNDDLKPYVYKTTDFGATWQSLANGLPDNVPLNCVREDPRQKDLLYLASDDGLHVSLNGGQSWHRIRGGFPPVRVDYVIVHPRDRDLVAATHGRSVWVIDVAPLQEMMTQEFRSADVHLFEVKPALSYQPRQKRNATFVAPNPPFGATIYYYLKNAAAKAPNFVITDAAGNPLATLVGQRDAGLHKLVWDLTPNIAADTPGAVRNGDAAADAADILPPGEYRVKMHVGDREFERPLQLVAPNPNN